MLNGCDTARPGSVSQPVAGAAAGLMLAGLPAVVAMQHRISDQAAILFTEAFYTTLARGAGIEEAVIEGRMAIHLQDRRSLEWITPALFLRGGEGLAEERAQQVECPGKTKEGLGPASSPSASSTQVRQSVSVGRDAANVRVIGNSGDWYVEGSD